ncbi:MAG: type IV secretion system DNA-binding domain-containing protein [Nitrospinae bacterium]|nr:type IV secretion system DNA-binding domain-containing protein [Nitrospinota bacterium]
MASGSERVFSGILHYCYANNLKTNSDIWMNVTAEIKEIANKLKQIKGGEAGYSYIQDVGKQAGSVISTMLQYVSAFRYMTNKSDDFSIFDWLEGGRGWLFITNYSNIKDTLRPMLSLFVDLVGTKLLSMRDDKRRRIFFILDEFSSLQKLATITDLLTRSRSKGGSVWLENQDIGTITHRVFASQCSIAAAIVLSLRLRILMLQSIFQRKSAILK